MMKNRKGLFSRFLILRVGRHRFVIKTLLNSFFITLIFNFVFFYKENGEKVP